MSISHQFEGFAIWNSDPEYSYCMPEFPHIYSYIVHDRSYKTFNISKFPTVKYGRVGNNLSFKILCFDYQDRPFMITENAVSSLYFLKQP